MAPRHARLRALARHIAIFLLFVALSMAATWPLAIRLSTAVSDPGDPLLNAWILDWTCHALVHQPLSLFDAPMFHPAKLSLAFSEHLAGIALVVLPFHLAGVPALTLYNIAMLLGFALSGYGAFVLARMFTTSFAACLAAGIFFAFVPFKFDHLSHLQVIWAGWLPLILAAMIAYWRDPTRRNAALFGAAFVMNGLSNVYYLLFAAAAIGVTAIFLLACAKPRDRRFWFGGLATLAVSGLVLLPFLQPYRVVSKLYHLRRWAHEVVTTGWSAWLTITPRSIVYGSFAGGQQHENQLFPGLVALFLIAAAIVLMPRRTPAPETFRAYGSPRLLRVLDVAIVLCGALAIVSLTTERFAIHLGGRPLVAVRGSDIPLTLLVLLVLARLSMRLPMAWGGAEGRTLRDVIARSRFPVEAWMAVVWIVAGFLGSFGLRAFFFSFLFRRVEVFQSMRAAPRFAIIAYAGMAVLIALGAAAILANRRGVKRAVVATLLVSLTFADLLAHPNWEYMPARPAPVYRWLAQEQVEPILEAPVDGWLTFRYLLGNTLHRLDTMNGTSGFEPPVHMEMRLAWEKGDFETVLARAEEHGARLLIVHAHWLTPEHQQPLRDFLRSAIDAGRLEFLRRFDHGIEGDFVFAIRRNLRDASRLRAPATPDPAGHFPAQILERFLDSRPTHSNTAFGHVEQPAPGAVVQGPLTVSGWAISPRNVRNVYVLIAGGRHRVEAMRVERPDITSRFGWYYEKQAGFTVTIPKRPFGVREPTDVQVEIVDTAGVATRLDDILIVWKDG